MAIVGGGFSGLAMAIRLREQGETDFVLLERAGDIGGVWRENAYPGCECDISSHVYSFSFAPNPDWTHTFSPRREIHEYLRGCADRFGVMPHVRLNCEVLSADWDDAERRWRIATSDGEIGARALVAAAGPISEPVIPAYPGLDRFQGISFHSAHWDDEEREIDGRRVAVIGTGATGVQIVPAIQPRVAQLTLFQRTAPWVLPRLQWRTSHRERALYRRLPIAQRAVRSAFFMLNEGLVLGFRRPRTMAPAERLLWWRVKRQVRDARLLAKLRPPHRLGCKRLLASNDYYPALDQPNVDVETAGIRSLRERSIVTEDGAEHEVDVIVWATGFHMTDPPFAERVRGRGGLTLADLWRREGFHALRGTTVPGFPNYFMMIGPNSGTGSNSMVFVIESQVRYVLDCLRALAADARHALEPRRDADARYNAHVAGRLRGTVWLSGCANHYQDATGRTSAIWPDSMLRFRAVTRRLDLDEYELGAVDQV